jgi:hypothetical protein
MSRAKLAADRVLRGFGYQLRRTETAPWRQFVDRGQELHDRHAAQTLDDVRALEEKYREPVFGEVRVYDLMRMLAECIDPMDVGLGSTSQLTHALQTTEALHDQGFTDPDVTLAALLHDVGKVLLLTGEDPANVCGNNLALGPFEPGAGLDSCAFQWNHDKFAYERLHDHLSDLTGWLVRYHSAELADHQDLLDDRDRAYHDRYFVAFQTADQGSKSPYGIPRTQLSDYRELLEDTFPDPIPF